MVLPVHFKVAYHSNKGEPIVTNVNLKEVRHIREFILKYLPTIAALVEEGPEGINMFDLDAREEEVIAIPNSDFEVVQLYNYPTRTVKKGSRLK